MTGVIAITLVTNSALQAQTQYDNSLLSLKKRFVSDAVAALSQPYRGVATSSGLVSGLFPIQTTGVSTEPIMQAASAFLATLTSGQLSRTHFAIDDPEWRNWSNVDIGIFARQGVSLEEMTGSQRDAAMELLRVSLSVKGLQLTRDIRKTEQALLDLNDNKIRYGEDKYYFTIMGVPSPEEPWGWQLDGHHLVINYFVLGDQVVMTPTFLGGEPVITESGKYKGNAILQAEQDQALAFMTSLNSSQRSRATLSSEKIRNNNQSAANKDNLILDYQGLPGSELNASQKQQLLRVIGLYVGNMQDDHARIRMSEVEQYLDQTYFAWVGTTSADAVFYYRIHSPVILIEFDHQNPVGTTQVNPPGVPTRQHIHVVVRTPNGNDYGKDLLRQHLESHAH